jgi:Flp pilus assembly protein TadB
VSGGQLVATVAGAGLGAGLWLLATGLRPPRRTLEEALHALRPTPAPDRAALPPDGDAGGGWAARAGRPAARRLAVSGLISRRTRRDLTVLGKTADAHAAEKVAAATVGFLLAPAIGGVLTLAGIGLGWGPPLAAAVLLGLAGFAAPDLGIWTDARRARADARYALSAFLDLTVIGLAGGGGVEQALADAADCGHGPTFTRLRRALDTARLTRTPPWQPLGELGRQIDLPELTETAATVTLAGTEGAAIRASLTARAGSLRTHALADAEADEAAASERLSLPVVVLFAGFLLFIGFPAVSHVLAGL